LAKNSLFQPDSKTHTHPLFERASTTIGGVIMPPGVEEN
jgi:hypothetical protein